MAEPQDKREQIGTAGMQVARSQPQGMVGISACVITKNEEKNIGRWLNCMRVAADEMIVVDTGSTDRTCELAQAAGARLYHFTWRDDFAAAKNYAPEGNVRDPWGQAYHVEVRRVATAKGRDLAAGGTAVYYPNAFRPVEGGAR